MTYVNRKGGRPSTFSPEVAAEILERLSAGATLREIARDPSMPAVSTITKWVLENRGDFADGYLLARQQQAFVLADELLEMITNLTRDIPDGAAGMPAVIARKEQIAAVRWLLTKILRHQYGERSEATALRDNAPRILIHLPGKQNMTRSDWEAIGHEVVEEPIPPISDLEGRQQLEDLSDGE